MRRPVGPVAPVTRMVVPFKREHCGGVRVWDGWRRFGSVGSVGSVGEGRKAWLYWDGHIDASAGRLLWLLL